MQDLYRNVSLLCPTCGNDQFETLNEVEGELKDADDTVRFKCSDCGLIISKEELLESNQEIINANVEDLGKDIVKEFEKELRKAVKKWH